MSPRGAHEIVGPTVSHRIGRQKPWRVRWRIATQAGQQRQFERNFERKAEAELLSSELTLMRARDVDWSLDTGMPEEWAVTGVTVAQAMRSYVEENNRDWSGGTYSLYVNLLTGWIPVLGFTRAMPRDAAKSEASRGWLLAGEELPKWGVELPIADLSERELQERWELVCTKEDGSRYAASSERTFRSVWRAFIGWCEDNQIVDDIIVPRQVKGKRRVGTITEVNEAELPSTSECRDAIAAVNNPDVRLIASLIFYTGMRTGEARALKVNDLRDGTIRIDETASDVPERYGVKHGVAAPKTGRIRTIPCPDLLMAQLREHVRVRNLEGDALLFQDVNGRPIKSGTVATIWRRQTNIGRMYVLRHVHATILLNSGVPIAAAARRLGHTPTVLVSTYAGVIGNIDRQDDIERNLRA